MSQGTPPQPVPGAASIVEGDRGWAAALLWAGGIACIGGMLAHGLMAQWVPARTAALAIIALLALALAQGLKRLRGTPVAHGLALAWLASIAWMGGVLPMLAVVATALAAIAIGSLLLPRANAGAQCATGLAIAGGLLGWLLSLPLHSRWSYLAVVVALVAWRRGAVLASLREGLRGWREVVADAPRPVAFAVLVLGLAATGCWVPTAQHDDVGYHLLLPWSLQLDGRLAMDPDVHAWALAPWAADVLQAIPQLIAGAEARGAMNALWLVVCAGGLWQLCAALGGDLRARAWSVALFASLPLTAVLAMGMQTELPAAALLAWAAWTGSGPASRRGLLAGCALLGLLAATKLASAGFALMMLPWLIWRHRTVLDPRTCITAAVVFAGLGGSSYATAWLIAGNPVLPLLNDVFGSPWFGGHYADARWHAGFGLDLPWRMTFQTERYLEARAGGGGFVMVAMAGAWAIAIATRRTRTLAVLSLLMAAAPLLATQYLRYAWPALVLALPVLVVAASASAPRLARILFIATCAANLMFQANGHWMLRTGAVKDSLVAMGRDAPVLEDYAPERLLAAGLRERWRAGEAPRGAVLALGLDAPMLAELGAHARTVAWYDPSLEAAAGIADADPSGAAWAALWDREGIAELMLHADRLPSARRAGLEAAGARLELAVQGVEWWRLPASGTGDATSP